jgi:hypothetical protein
LGDLKRCNQQVWNKILNIKSRVGQPSGTWELLLSEYGRKSFLAITKMASKSWQEDKIWWYHWNQGENVAPLHLFFANPVTCAAKAK